MKHSIVALAAVVALAAPVARAAEPAHAAGSNVSIGFGVGLEPIGAFANQTAVTGRGTTPVAFYVPIQIGPQLRIEPSFGIWHFGGNSAVINPSSITTWSLGVGGLFYLVPTAPTGIYVGGRLALGHSSETNRAAGANVDTSSTDFSIAPVLGGEYAFAPRFTVGAEVQLPITFVGNESTNTGGTTTTVNADRNTVGTNAVVFLRYFFM